MYLTVIFNDSIGILSEQNWPTDRLLALLVYKSYSSIKNDILTQQPFYIFILSLKYQMGIKIQYNCCYLLADLNRNPIFILPLSFQYFDKYFDCINDNLNKVILAAIATFKKNFIHIQYKHSDDFSRPFLVKRQYLNISHTSILIVNF